jgi:hypothetical protein
MDAIDRAMRWFFAERNAWVLWPVGMIAVILVVVATGLLNRLAVGALLMVMPLAWLVGLLGIGTRDNVNKIARGWASPFAGMRDARAMGRLLHLPVWPISNWMTGLLWWLLVVYIEIVRRSRVVSEGLSGPAEVKR